MINFHAAICLHSPSPALQSGNCKQLSSRLLAEDTRRVRQVKMDDSPRINLTAQADGDPERINAEEDNVSLLLEHDEDMRTVQSIIAGTLSQSTKRKIAQARVLLRQKAVSVTPEMGDPVVVTPRSEQLVINVLFEYSGMINPSASKEELKSESAVSGIISGLRWAYRAENHNNAWSIVKTHSGVLEAYGNPLLNNIHIREFRRCHLSRLSEMGKVARSAPPLTPYLIIEHARQYMIRINDPNFALDIADVLLHALLLTSMNCGMRYDEISKIEMKNVSVHKQGVELGVDVKCKNSIKYRKYSLRRWPGEKLSTSALMDPMLALSAWLLVRGDAQGFLFCSIVGESPKSLKYCTPWSKKHFESFMARRFVSLGIGQSIARTYTGHSGKRGGVQLLRFLGCKDIFIMNWFGMTGSGAYLRYTEAFNDLTGTAVPDFASIESLFAHARARQALDTADKEDSSHVISDWLQEQD